MATYCALHVATADIEGVRDAVLDWMQRQHGATAIRETLQSRLPRDYYANFLLDEDAAPEMFIVGSTPSGWVTAHFNSFKELTDLTAALSDRFDTTVINVMAQSVSSVYYVQVARRGRHLRTLYYVGEQGEWVRQDGDPLEFEAHPLGTNLAEADAEPDYVFERSDVAEYCRHLGLELWDNHGTDAWHCLAAVGPRAADETIPRPWWRFWG